MPHASTWHSRLAPWLSGLVIVAALAALYFRFILRPEEFFIGDLVSYYQPMRQYVSGCLGEGKLPMWTTALFAGTPQIADAQLAIFYPPTWLHLWVSFPLSELILLLGHLFLGGIGVLFLARRLGLGRASALFAALGYSLSGFFVSHLVHPNFVHSAAWIPWLLGLLHGVVAGPQGAARRASEVALAAAATAGCLLAGGVQIAYLGLGMAAVMALVWVIATPDLDHRSRLLRGAAAVGALSLGVGLAAVQLLPTAELAPLSIRAEGVTLELARSYRLAARQGLGLVVPFPFGLAERTPVVWSQPFHESFGYFGVSALPLALTALFGFGIFGSQGQPLGVRAWRLGLPRLVLGAIALCGLFAAMGPEAPVDVHRWLFELLPGFDRFRAPGRLLFLVLTPTILLAAFGLQDLLGGDENLRARARRLHLGFSLLMVGVACSVGLLASGAGGPMPEATAELARRSALGSACVVLAVVALVRGGARWRVARAWVGAGVVAIHLLDLVTVGRAVVAARQLPDGVDPGRLAHRPPPEAEADPGRAHHDHRVLYQPDSCFMLQNAGLLHGYDNLRTYSPGWLRRTYDLSHLADQGRF
ncbi:MAG: hypothetical protein RBU30_07510, partial [Polyangia bacterium]|nr:hypothetical protein [Polyangia bacterium]